MAQAINKKCGENDAFTEQDEKVGKIHYFTFILIKLTVAQLCIVYLLETIMEWKLVFSHSPTKQNFLAS